MSSVIRLQLTRKLGSLHEPTTFPMFWFPFIHLFFDGIFLVPVYTIFFRNTEVVECVVYIEQILQITVDFVYALSKWLR